LLLFFTLFSFSWPGAARSEEAAAGPASTAAGAAKEETFEIAGFLVEGYTVFPRQKMLDVVARFVGRDKTAADVEKARDALEKYYHEEGYPTALVNIPEQSIGNGFIRLQVIESTIGKVTVSGNRYFTTDKILADLPSFRRGEMLYLPTIQKEITAINRNPDLKVRPGITPSREVGVIDVDLKVEDQSPLHGSVEVNNKASVDTTELRLAGSLRYDNLWQREHSISLQYDTSPMDTSQVQVFSGSYTLPLPWDRQQKFVVYGVDSLSSTPSKEFNVAGKGIIIGARYVTPLPAVDDYSHTLSFGVDYKDFLENLEFAQSSQSSSNTATPVHYFPFSLAYSSALPDAGGLTQFSLGVNFSFRGVIAEQSEFTEKRFKGQSNYIYTTLGVERTQRLPAGFGLYVKLDGQLTDAPLISNEQFIAGGMESVRGYHESEVAADNGVHGTVELIAPDLAPRLGLGERAVVTPYLFYDFAETEVLNPLAGQNRNFMLQGTGIGVRGNLFRSLEFQTDAGFALENTGTTSRGDNRVNFKVKYQF
jgi:hemolysin activation/secretion protein